MVVAAHESLLPINHGLIARIFATRSQEDGVAHGGLSGWICLKVVDLDVQRPPHDVRREVGVLSRCWHPNIVPLLGVNIDISTVTLTLPLYPLALADLLRSPFFSPLDPPRGVTSGIDPLDHARGYSRPETYSVVAASLIGQTCRGIAHLHAKGIAWRDVKPENILIGVDGQVRLIDFGTASVGLTSDAASSHRAYTHEVGTSHYRAPELLFGATNYDPCALDLWSLGVLVTEFFTPFILSRSGSTYDTWESSGDAEGDSGAQRPLAPYLIPAGHSDAMAKWTRGAIFSDEWGDVGLIASIFAVLGSPTDITWPSFASLPDAGKLCFIFREPTPLALCLPNLAPESDGKMIDFLGRLLQFEPSHRATAEGCLSHPWIKDHDGLLPQASGDGSLVTPLQWAGKTLGQHLAGWIAELGWRPPTVVP